MSDWTDEVRARMVREEERLRYKAANLQARGKTVMAAQELVVADDIRAALAEIERLREACIRKDCDYGLEIRHLREAVREIRGRALASRGRDVGKVEARARLDCIAEAARAALRGGGE